MGPARSSTELAEFRGTCQLNEGDEIFIVVTVTYRFHPCTLLLEHGGRHELVSHRSIPTMAFSSSWDFRITVRDLCQENH